MSDLEPEQDCEPAYFPDDESRALAKASGYVPSSLRLVAFLFLLTRDHVPVGVVANCHCRAMSGRMSWDEARDSLSRDDRTKDAPERLTDRPTVRLVLFLAELLDEMHGAYNRDQTAAELQVLMRKLPGADDVKTYFSNGWLARYAEYVATDLLRR